MSYRSVVAAAIGSLLLAAPVLPHATATTALPDGYPSPADCKTIDDGSQADGTVQLHQSDIPGTTPDVNTPNDPDLDIKWAAIGTTPTDIVAYIKISQLGDAPSQANQSGVPFNGDRFLFQFNIGTKQFTYGDGRVVGPLATQSSVPRQMPTNGVMNVIFDKTNSFVVIKIGRAGLEAANGAPVPDGTVFTKVLVQTTAIAVKSESRADTAKVATESQQVYTVGDNTCFPAPPSTLVNAGSVRTQFTDAAPVAAKLTNAAGTGLAGKTVKFTVASKTVSAVTGTDGVAHTSIDPGVPAGTYSLVETFDGDSSAAKVTLTTPFTVVPEVTKLTFKVNKAGSQRTVIATLKDDDGHAVASQPVNWYVNGKKVGTSKTNGSGIATLATAKPTQTVKAEFTGVSGKYLKSSLTAKV